MSRSSKWIRRSKRWAIYHRDGFRCVYCRAEEGRLTLDHVYPDSGDDATNLVTACYGCNSAKQDLSLRAWYAKLRKRGLNTKAIGRRVRRLTMKPLDRALGRRLAKSELPCDD